jgi:hypothetical protein
MFKRENWKFYLLEISADLSTLQVIMLKIILVKLSNVVNVFGNDDREKEQSLK